MLSLCLVINGIGRFREMNAVAFILGMLFGAAIVLIVAYVFERKDRLALEEINKQLREAKIQISNQKEIILAFSKKGTFKDGF
jgi:hypothetical protein